VRSNFSESNLLIILKSKDFINFLIILFVVFLNDANLLQAGSIALDSGLYFFSHTRDL